MRWRGASSINSTSPTLNWRNDFQLTLHKQDEVNITRPTGNIFPTNIHRVYTGNDTPPSPDDENTMDYFLGKRPTGATTDSKVDLGMIVRDINELMVLNDEAHHIHNPPNATIRTQTLRIPGHGGS